MDKSIDLIDVLLDYLQDAYNERVVDYSIFHIEDYKIDKCSYREFHWVSTTRDEDEPYYVVAYSPSWGIINKTVYTPSDLLVQLANISIELLMHCIYYMEDLEDERSKN